MASPLDLTADEFRHLAAQVADLAAEFLANLDTRSTFPSTNAARVEQLFHTAPPVEGLGGAAFDMLTSVAQHSRVQNGRFFGYVLGSGEPIGALADMFASVLNQNVTAWRSGPAAATIEHIVVEWLAWAIGCTGFRGSLTGGGSSANLMALAMAREAKLPANEKGLHGAPQGTFYASTEVHMSIAKSIALLGIGRESLRLIPTDDSFRLIPAGLEGCIASDVAEGKTPIAVIACAGTVNTGAIDPLPEIAAIAKRHQAWLHVDGAYGALAAMAAPEKFRGLELADSLSLDPHKWLYQPLDCGCLLYRDSATARAAFSHTGDYARTLTADPVEGFAFFEESLELSRRFRALKLWLSLRYHGLQAFRAAIQKDLDLAQRLAASIAAHPELEILAPVGLSAICFRYKGNRPRSEEDLNKINRDLLQRVVKRGRVYLSNAVLRGKFCLRACLVNHRTTEADVDSVVPEVMAALPAALSS